MSQIRKVASARGDHYLVEDTIKVLAIGDTMLPGDDAEDHNKKIGSCMGPTGKPLTGLTAEEEEVLLPKIIKVKPTSEHWEEAVDLYGHNISKKVPNKGLPLDISMKFKNETDAEKYVKRLDKVKVDITDKRYQDEMIAALSNMCNGEPKSVADYILWRYCLVYNKVANEPELKNKSKRIWFYLYDKNREKRKSVASLKSRSVAYERYLKVMTSMESTKQVLLLFGIDPTFYEDDEMLIQLEKKAVSEPNKFVAFTEKDYDTQGAAFIRACINVGILEVVPNTEIIKETAGEQNVLGNTLDSAVTYLKSEKGKRVKNLLKAQMSVETKM